MTVSSDQIAKAKAQGLKNVDAAAVAADETGNKFYHLCALLEKENNGRNSYGHDDGGALNGFPKDVNQGNYEVFRWLVFTKGQTSNGVGPMQLTFKGFFTDMELRGLKPWNVDDNITYGADLWLRYYRLNRNNGYSRDDSILRAGRAYNPRAGYAEKLLEIMNKWLGIVGNSDYA